MKKCFSFTMMMAATAVTILAQSPDQGHPRPNGRIASAVASAKQRGHGDVTIPALGTFPTGVDTIEAAADKYSVFLVEPVSITVSASAEGLTTWYTVQTDEILLKQRADSVGNDLAPPFPLDALASGQLLLPISGGQATVDGVVVHEAPAFRLQLRVGQKYLLVLYLQQGSRIGELAAQADGVFELNQDGSSIKSLRASSRLGQDVQARWASRLDTIRTFLKARAIPQQKQ